MQPQIISHNETRSEFKDARVGKLGSSDIATVCGLNRWKTPLHLFAEMTGRIPIVDIDNRSMRLGRKLEPVVAEEFEEETGFVTLRSGKTYGRDDIPWGIATPDYLFKSPEGPEGPLECKVTNEFLRSEWEGQIPDAAHLQAHWQMGFTGYKHAYVAAIIGGRDFACQELQWNEQIFDQLVQVGENFMQKVKLDIPPPAIDQDIKLVQVLNGDLTGDVHNFSIEETYHVQTYMKYRDQRLAREKEIKAEKEKEDTLRALILQILGKCSTGNTGHVVVTQKLIERVGYSVEPASYVQLTCKEPKGKK